MTQAARFPASVATFKSEHGFSITVARLRGLLADKGMTIFVDIDQSEAAAQVGMTLRPTRLIVFGNPKGGTPVMEANPHAGLLLPLKALVWEDQARATWLAIDDITQALVGGYGLDAPLVEPLAKAKALIQMAAARDPV
ncbi:DUF302 domain-containing protein [Paraburkholderia sp. LEh10]|jgi:uncharacterized protein (DUF302 family)|uniref:DUF302 domain-containing protein n=1 Tax=Paraburkholderia sp. LEh10 TaxID=2821353 RepID=UPI001AE9A9F9|nr:DUF302 domain-containing protein [Paraburkholderia sp. LEh10]MBP0590125.1 DUF302 domain-containing protein [Paraburkholderia sp. LEh10]